jgi:hypothetical protein
MPDTLPDLPAHLTDEQKQRYVTIAAIAQRAVDRLPRQPDKFIEPAHVFTLHIAGSTPAT